MSASYWDFKDKYIGNKYAWGCTPYREDTYKVNPLRAIMMNSRIEHEDKAKLESLNEDVRVAEEARERRYKSMEKYNISQLDDPSAYVEYEGSKILRESRDLLIAEEERETFLKGLIRKYKLNPEIYE